MQEIILISELFIIAAVITYLAMPLIRWFAVRHDLYDQPTARKIHTKATPRVGGLMIFLSFLFCLVIFQLSTFRDFGQDISVTILPSAIIMFLLGFYDDLLGVRSYKKLLVQIAAASCAFFSGFRIEQLTLFEQTYFLGHLDFFITVAWIIFVTNAYNLIDGMDGLAGGVALIALLAISGLAILSGNFSLTLTAFILAGTLFGFLQHNLTPASIFMGDSGSYFVGFMLSVLSLELLQPTGGMTTVSGTVPLLILGIPLFDTVLAIGRRLIKYSHYLLNSGKGLTVRNFLILLRRVLAADSEHVHHVLLAHGRSQRQVVTRLYYVSMILAAAAIVTPYVGAAGEILIVSVAVFAAILSAAKLGLAKYLVRAFGKLQTANHANLEKSIGTDKGASEKDLQQAAGK